MEHNEIIKAWECCLTPKACGCDDCPLGKDGSINCKWLLLLRSLSLIKELTEENERLRAERDVLDITVKDLRGRNKGLQRANESLAKDIAQLEAELCECVQIKADTVRKMHSEIEKRCIKGGIYPAFVKSTIDQIAKEMPNENM